jgi:hypothetical protein
VLLPAVAATLVGYAVRDFLGTWVAVLAGCIVMTALLAAARPFSANELQLVGRGTGRIVTRILGPFAREATT